jgi:hypothetical protein
MPGPPPKDPRLRGRRNKTSTRAKLTAAPAPPKPDLPSRADDDPWHPQVVSFWESVWASPMADEFVEADHHGLFKLAQLEQDFWTARSPTARKEAATEIRLQRQCFGLSPLDRRRLQWEIDRGEEADSRTRKRRTSKASSSRGKKDPRAALAV